MQAEPTSVYTAVGNMLLHLVETNCSPADAAATLRSVLESFPVVMSGMCCTGLDEGKRPIHLVIVGVSCARLVERLLESDGSRAMFRVMDLLSSFARSFLLEFRAARHLILALVGTGLLGESASRWREIVAPPENEATDLNRAIAIDGFRVSCQAESSHLAAALLRQGVVVNSNRLLHDAILQIALAEARDFHRRGLMRPASVKSAGRYFEDTASRGDVVRWLDGADREAPACMMLTQWLRGELMDEVRRACALAPPGTNRGVGRASHLRLEGEHSLPLAMLACYPGGGSKFKRHVDNDKEQMPDHRVVTAILYLNDDWMPGDGGELRLHHTRRLGANGLSWGHSTGQRPEVQTAPRLSPLEDPALPTRHYADEYT